MDNGLKINDWVSISAGSLLHQTPVRTTGPNMKNSRSCCVIDDNPLLLKREQETMDKLWEDNWDDDDLEDEFCPLSMPRRQEAKHIATPF